MHGIYQAHPSFFNTSYIYLGYTRHMKFKHTYSGHIPWKRMNSMMMRICVHVFYLANSICAEFRSNTAKTRSTVHDRRKHSMSVNHYHRVWLVTTNRLKSRKSAGIASTCRNASLCAPSNLIWIVQIKLHCLEQIHQFPIASN